MRQPAVTLSPTRVDREAVATALGLTAADLSDAPVQGASTAVEFLMVGLRDLDALARIQLDASKWRSLRGACEGLYPFVVVGPDQIRARMVGCPGIEEDPATGSAAGPCAGYLRAHGIADGPLTIHQGVEMGRPGALHLHAHDDHIHLAGTCREIGGGFLDIPA